MTWNNDLQWIRRVAHPIKCTKESNAESRVTWVRVDSFVGSENLSTVWWPGLLYSSHDELQKSIPRENGALKREIFCLRIKVDASSKYVVLLGKDRPGEKLISVIPPDKEEKVLEDFYSNVERMQDLFKDDKGWNEAYNEITLLLTCKDVTGLFSDPRGELMAMDDIPVNQFELSNFLPPLLTKSRKESEQSSHGEILTPASDLKELKPTSTRVHSSKISCRKSANNLFNESKTVDNKVHVDEPQKDNSSQLRSHRHEDTKQHDTMLTTLSPCQPKERDDKLRTLTPSPPVIQLYKKKSGRKRKLPKFVAFKEAFGILKKDHGWTCINGRGVVSFYYIPPQHAGISPKKLIKLTKNRDYFETEPELKRYVHKTYGWVGLYGGQDYVDDSRKRKRYQPPQGSTHIKDRRNSSASNNRGSKKKKKPLKSGNGFKDYTRKDFKGNCTVVNSEDNQERGTIKTYSI